MRLRTKLAWLLAVLAGTSITAGCYDAFHDCTFWLCGTGGGGTGGGGTGGTTTTTIDPGCHPSVTPNPVRDDCGLFVSSSKGDDKNDGKSKDKAFATIAKALASPDSGPIYLCGETFAEAVKIKSGRTIYGGLDCAKDWSWSAETKSEVSPAAGEVPLVVDPQVGLVVEDVAWRAKNAVEAGGSSIAVIVTSGADVTFARCDVEAGTAKDGEPAEVFQVDASAGTMGNAGADACTAANVNGGGSAKNACEDADLNDDSIGGKGGSSDEFSGGPGAQGSPGMALNAGVGEDGNNPVCTNGTAGDDGGPGASATGAAGPGSISPQGYAGTPGTSGDKGKPGQGGGGGGGAKGGTGANKCAAGTDTGGASGGSGGSAGCGGSGGKGGQAGGASIGIVSIDAKLSFVEKVTVTTKKGGNGGAGGDGQLGGNGGSGGPGGTKGGFSNLKDGCKGGQGGQGGPGGRGGGGLGGPSIGIAFTGDAPPTKDVTFTIGTPGDGGAGDGAMGAGAKGVAAETHSFGG